MEIIIDKSVEDIFTAFKPDVKSTTIKQYSNQIKHVHRTYGDPDNLNDYSFLLDYDELSEKILSVGKYTTHRNLFNVIAVFMMALKNDDYLEAITKYSDERDKGNEIYKLHQQSGKISESQAEKFIPLKEMEDMLLRMKNDITKYRLRAKDFDKLSRNEKELFTVFTLFTVLLEIPLRGDLFNMKLIIGKTDAKSLDENHNYMIHSREGITLVLFEYKTNATYGRIDIKLSKETTKVVRAFLKRMKRKSHEEVFQTTTGAPIGRAYGSQLLTRTTQNYLGKKISTTMIRKIVASDKFGDVDFQKKKEDQALLAHNMGHSIATQDEVYIKSV
jgi:hypothetical protein